MNQNIERERAATMIAELTVQVEEGIFSNAGEDEASIQCYRSNLQIAFSW